MSNFSEKVSKGRLENIEPSVRSKIAQNATLARWTRDGKYHGEIQETTHEGILFLLDQSMPCAVLRNGKRVLTQSGLHRAIGKHERYSGNSSLPLAHLPPFLRSKSLTPLLTHEITLRATPIVFKTLEGNLALGYDADFLVDICILFLEARRLKLLKPNQRHIAAQCEILTQAFARVGLIALIDEATNFQKERKRDALSDLLKIYLTEEMQKWVKAFPFEYFENIYRLKRISMQSKKNPQWMGHVTNNLVYSRLAPGILEELKQINPKDEETGKRKGCHHQFLTPKEGRNKLKSHFEKLNIVASLADDWDSYMKMVDKVLPKFREVPDLPKSV